MTTIAATSLRHETQHTVEFYCNLCFHFPQTPGPGTYRVWNPNIVKFKHPAYSITGRNAMPGDSTKKPGPGAYSPEKVVACF